MRVGSSTTRSKVLKKRIFIRIQEAHYWLFNHLEPPPNGECEEGSTAIPVGMLVVGLCIGASDRQYVTGLIAWVVNITITWIAVVKRSLHIFEEVISWFDETLRS